MGLNADADRCRELTTRSLMLVTALAPALGYDVAAEVAKEALVRGLSIRDVVLERALMDPAAVDRALDPGAMTLANRTAPHTNVGTS